MHSHFDFPFPQVPATGATLTLAPGIEWLRMPLPFALNHINLWLLADGHGNDSAVAAVDTGFTQDVVKQAWKQVLAGRRLTRCLVTHYHPDHLGMADWLGQETGAELWISQGDYLSAQMVRGNIANYSMNAMLDYYRSYGLSAPMLAVMAERGNVYSTGVPTIPRSYRRLFPHETLAIGNHVWRTIPGYGHAPEHMSFYCGELRVLISGDMLLPRITTNVMATAVHPDSNPLKWFLDSLEAFRTLPQDTLVLPSHGKPFRGLHMRIEELHAHHANRFRLLLNACKERPHSAGELIPILFDRPIDDPHQTMFAMGESIAHLHYLEHEDRVRRIDGNDCIRFETV